MFDNLSYNKDTGELFLTTPKGIKQIIPNLNFVQFTINNKRYKFKYTNLIWYLVHGVKPSVTEKIFHKDLDENNYKLNNLVKISTKLYFQLKEALDNLHYNLKLYPHPKDSYSYILEYKQKGRLRKEIISDIGIARKKMLKLQLRIVKFTSAYVITS